MADKKEDPQTEPQQPAEVVKEAKHSQISNWLPVIMVIILLPLLTFVMMRFLFLPQIKSLMDPTGELATNEAANKVVAEKKENKESHETKKESGKSGSPEGNSVKFENIVANLSGSLQSRYVKVSFMIEGSDPNFENIIQDNKVKLIDVTLGILSNLTISDLEQPGIRNVIRSDLLGAFENTLKGRYVEHLYFSEFVVQ